MNDFAQIITENTPAFDTQSVRDVLDTLASAADRHDDRARVLDGFRMLVARRPERVPSLIGWVVSGRDDLVVSVLADMADLD